jgi:glycolate dehydrogenase FAD-binding subunit
MAVLLEPSTAFEVSEAVRASSHVVPVGAETKPAMSAVPGERISTRGLSGIIEYDPSEFTFTALAGTPMKEIVHALAERGQYLPFDPMLVDAGATLGGTIASGLSGPGRFRFGGIRDFILGVQFVDGLGRLLRMGGKVVKNAAGFDVPKFLTGSLGRFGFITEATFKVFPRPEGYVTLRLDLADMESAVQIMTAAGRARWELDALDILPDQTAMALRLGGPASGISALSKEILSRWPGKQVEADAADGLWSGLREFRWVDADAAIIKVPLTPKMLAPFTRQLANVKNARAHISAGGNVGFVGVSGDEIKSFDESLRELTLQGMMLRGPGPLWLGRNVNREISRGVKRALDPENRYPELED